MAEYIDREPILKFIVNGLSNPEKDFDIVAILTEIQYAPVARVEEVKHGYWINHYSDLYPADCTQECSICHAEEGGNLWNDNYCPNCGARMDGRSET